MGAKSLGIVLSLCVSAGVAISLSAPAFAQRPPVEHIRGTVAAVDASAVTVRTREGAVVKVALPAKYRISGLAKASLAGVAKGTYIGTAAMPGPDGILVAQELLIFPDRMRGVGEGHRPWDLTPGSTMTNATVDIVVEQVKGRVLTLSYKGERKQVLVPPEAPVVTIVKASRDELKPGANVFVVARKSPGGGLSAVRIAIGKDGLVPPM